MEAWKEEFDRCLKRFREFRKLENIGFSIESSEKPGVDVRRPHGKLTIVLGVPPLLQDKPALLRPFILYGLSLIVDPKNPNRVFNKVADEKSKEFLKTMKEKGALKREL